MVETNRDDHSAESPQVNTPPPEHRVAAFFDLDKTIIATSSAYAFGKEFMHNGLISHTEAFQISLAKGTYMVAGHSSEQMDASRDQLTSLVSGWSVSEVSRITTEAMHTVVTPVIYSEARELIDFHKAAGHDVIIISASASQLVEPIAAELGIDQVVATELEVADGRFTGEILFYAKGDAKAQAIADLAEANHYDLASSFAYSDSATDIPMLEMVGNPVAVNPDRAMKKHALESGWEVRSFKDPVPLFPLPNARDVGIGAGVIAALAALTAGGWWLAQRGRRPGETPGNRSA
ncbi:HAD family hydrolase [Corynebacterium guangdongense]|uniref:HAD superfamily hydrolase (TIGR01490 family) n=1 Tax=Corynebacterium guangdongense TaxID=1783348 RepID=A0ABU2A0V1_9CORY|nr:HAD family hydrolase [Corynebacterium guangdongense]MDR7330817.1 HAD superfamily hydrolase (TIGR01490 family) [Corynebacterium guangdongense]WJZ16832.1 Phosphoserine phosphatase [Corynebacterium guangdongense]